MSKQARRRPWRGMFSNLDFVIDLMIAIATIIISLGIFIYSIVGRASPAVISSGTLAILGLLAYSVLRNRQTDQTIKLSLDDLAHALPARSLGAFAQQEVAYKELEAYVATRRVRRAALIQYSGTMCMDLVKALLSSGAHVTLYLQHEETAKLVGTAEQQDRIAARRRWLRGELAGEYDLSKLELRRYRAPASLRAVSITTRTEKVLCMGWYTYEDVAGVERPQRQDFPDDTVEVSGHDVAAVMVWRGAEGFDALEQTFATLEQHYLERSELVAI